MAQETFRDNTEKKESSFNVKKQLATLFAVLSMQLGIAQTKTIDTNTTTKSQTEVVTNNILSPEKILEKHKITDIKTATIEQLELAVNDLSLALKTLVGKDREPYLILKSDIKGLIMVKKSEEEKLIAEKIAKSLTGEKN